MNFTAVNSDEWISVKPGSEGALALGIANIIIQKNLQNDEFLEKFAYGFDYWYDAGKKHSGFKELVLRNYPPRKVSEITGVQYNVIEKLAIDFVKNQPSLAFSWYDSTETTNSFYNSMCIESLNALVASVDVPGGVILQKSAPLGEWEPTVKSADESESLKKQILDILPNFLNTGGSGNLQAYLESLANHTPYPTKILINCGSNPIFEQFAGNGYNRSFDQIEFSAIQLTQQYSRRGLS